MGRLGWGVLVRKEVSALL
uniref:Uncharacterized protein n=1 Tax=Anguilla anguilla TaxID=7936 RepID=A0A0E9PA22_ANGAN